MVYELWYSDDECSYSYLAKNENYEKSIALHKKLAPDLEMIWTYKAKSYNDAMQAYNTHLGYGEYKPVPGWDDIVYD